MTFPILIRLLVTATTLFSLLGPLFADALAREQTPPLRPAEATDASPGDLHPRTSRRTVREDHTSPPPTAGEGSLTGEGSPTGDADLEQPPVVTTRWPDDGTVVVGTIDPEEPLRADLLPPALRDRVDGMAAPDGPRDAKGGANGSAGPNTDGPSGFKAGPGCSVQCIVSGVAYARGVNARLVLQTDTPALMTLHVYGATPNSYHVSSEHGQLSQAFTVDLANLQPGTAYDVLATARDADGHTSYATGSFTTLRRTAEVTFHLNWQVDQSPYDARYHYHYRVAQQWRPALTVGHWPHPSPPVNLPAPVPIDDAPRHLDVAAQVVVEDATHQGHGQGQCPVEGGSPPPFGPFDGAGGPSGYGESTTSEGCHPIAWATAASCTAGIDLDDRPADATSWTEHTLPFAVTTANGCTSQPLGFTVPGTIEVRYLP